MIGKFKKSFLMLLKEIKKLQHEPKNFVLSFTIQKLVRKKIIYIEKRINLVKKRWVNEIENRNKYEAFLEDYKWLLYLFRTICDGIVFIYYDKWDVKPFYYNSDFTIKQNSGYVSGKVGAKNEFAVFKYLIKRGYPAILCDLTNVIRQGDVCIPSSKGSPQCTEVKSTFNPKNKRAIRQLKNLFELNNYIDSDKSKARIRIPIYAKEVNYIKTLNALIQRAYREGIAFQIIEEGMAYLVVKKKLNFRQLNSYTKQSSELSEYDKCFILFADQKEWGMYYPFTLSITEPEHILDFILCEINILICLNTKTIVRLFAEKGYIVKINIRSPYPISIIASNNTEMEPAINKVGYFLFYRVIYEFTSLNWLVNELIQREAVIQKHIQAHLSFQNENAKQTKK